MIRKLQSYNKFIVVLILASLVGSSLISPLASAASVYDDAYQQTETLEIRGEGYGQDCSTENIISSWSSKLLADPSVGSSFGNALESGSWAIAQTKTDNGMAGVHDDFVRIYWTESNEMELDFQHMFSTFYETRLVKSDTNQPIHQALIRSNFAGYVGGQNCNIIVQDAGTSDDALFTHNFTMTQGSAEIRGYIAVNVNVNYPDDYEGDVVANGSIDEDEDGLSFAKESAQGTSDNSKDTDGDGLSDYVESQWYPSRQSVFCGTSCTYPNPTQKDIYVEIDWMKNSSNQVFKPTNSQLSLVEDMYADKGINFHADTGQYGGGNELAVYTHSLSRVATSGQVDFWDYKNGGDGIAANFSSDRSLIWRYLIYGYEYASSSGTSSGWSEVMGDDIFISGGWINNLSGLASLDRAIANTIAHETGHALCLSSVQVFVEQPAGCIYDGVDNDDPNDAEYNLANYKSVMNYRYQLTDQDDMDVVNYSDGSHGTGDHDDWNGVLAGMGGFAGTKTALGAIAKPHYITPDGGVIILEAPIDSPSLENRTEDLVSVMRADSQRHTGNGASGVDEDVSSKVEKVDSTKDSWMGTGIIVSSVVATSLLAVGIIAVLRRRA